MEFVSRPLQVLLIHPSLQSRRGAGRLVYTSSPPLGLCYVAAALRRDGHGVRIIDLQVSDARDLAAEMQQMQPDLIGLSCQTETYDAARALGRRLRQAAGVPVVMGGPHVSALPEIALVEGAADAVVRGEGEEPMRRIAARLSAGAEPFGGVAGVSYVVETGAVHGPAPEAVENLDELPFPALDLVPMERYRPGANRHVPVPFVPMVTGRGCPYRCRYCSSRAVFGARPRFRSVTNVQEELDHWRGGFGIRGLMFWDDTFTLDRDRALALCEMLNDQGVEWSCTTRPDRLDRDLAHAMRRSGCRFMYIGAESFSLDTLRVLGRTTTPEQVRTAVRDTMSEGIRTSVGIVTGCRDQSLASAVADIRSLLALWPDYPTINILSEYPSWQTGNPPGEPAGDVDAEAYPGRRPSGMRKGLLRLIRFVSLGLFYPVAAARKLYHHAARRIKGGAKT